MILGQLKALDMSNPSAANVLLQAYQPAADAMNAQVQDASTALLGKSVAYYQSYVSNLQAAFSALNGAVGAIGDGALRQMNGQVAGYWGYDLIMQMQQMAYLAQIGHANEASAKSTMATAANDAAQIASLYSQMNQRVGTLLGAVQAKMQAIAPEVHGSVPPPQPPAVSPPPSQPPASAPPASSPPPSSSSITDLPMPVLIGVVAVAGFLAWRLLR